MYKLGSFYRICDRTGFKVRAEDTREEWNGAIVSKHVYEARHPQDMVRGRKDKQTVPNPRPRQADTWVTMPTVLYAEDGNLLQAESDSLLTEE
jgi:hypothetical protein